MSKIYFDLDGECKDITFQYILLGRYARNNAHFLQLVIYDKYSFHRFVVQK